jgi:type I site-specific restriction endonuclease
MDSRDLSQVELLVELVGEKINAQVSAHEKYSLAFIKILDTLDTIIEQQDEITSGDTSFYKKLIEDIDSLSKDIRDEDEAQKNWRDSLVTKFDSFINVSNAKVKELQDKIEDSVEASDKSYIELNTKISAILEKVESIEESNETNHTFMEDQIEQIIDTRKKMKQTIEKLAIYFGALVSIIGIIMTLMQLNILNITWGHK